jgi:hypothetical protein
LRITWDYPVAVAHVWTASRNMVQNTNPAATEILQLCAFLAPEAIPEEIFTKGAVALEPVLQVVTAAMFAFNKPISILRKYSLINRDVDRETDTTRLSISRILQNVLQSEMDEETQHLWVERAVRSVYQTLPFVEWQVMLPHVRACLQHIKRWDMTCLEAELVQHHAESQMS